MVNVRIDEDTLIDMLVERVRFWTTDEDVINLFASYYKNMVYGGCFDGMEFDIAYIVDNDYINNMRVVYESDDEYGEIKKVFDEQGLGDCSCECDCCDFIESTDESNTMFLVC